MKALLPRRDFLRYAARGAGGLTVVPRAVWGSGNAGVYTPRMAVNPSIGNLRVVCGVNPAMITGEPSFWGMEGQNAPVAADPVERTLDAMACALAQKAVPAEAWKTIFRKPETKAWSGVRAALKVNCIPRNHPRVAVVNKICIELNRLGVPFGNIIIYDGCSNAFPLYGPYVGRGLPAGVVVSEGNRALGGTVETAIPLAKKTQHACTRHVADGTIDILVNLAVNKGITESVGQASLTLKNHAGTFAPRYIHMGGGLDYILAFNKSDAIWGGSPVRQQLCLVDSLWGGGKGWPWAAPEKRLDRLLMGTFSGAVDYLTAKKIREPLQGVTHGPVGRFVTDFGYAEKELEGLVTVSA